MSSTAGESRGTARDEVVEEHRLSKGFTEDIPAPSPELLIQVEEFLCGRLRRRKPL